MPTGLQVVLNVWTDMQTNPVALRADLHVHLHAAISDVQQIDGIVEANLERMHAGIAETFLLWAAGAVGIAGVRIQGGEVGGFEVERRPVLLVAAVTSSADESHNITLINGDVVGLAAFPAGDVNAILVGAVVKVAGGLDLRDQRILVVERKQTLIIAVLRAVAQDDGIADAVIGAVRLAANIVRNEIYDDAVC